MSELSRLYRAYAEGSALESIALKTATIIPCLLLQKPHRKSKSKDHTTCLAHKLRLWTDRDFNALLEEGRALQRQPQGGKAKKNAHHLVWTFANIMFERKTKAFLQLLCNEIRDLTANLLSEVCNEVCIEPHLQPISSEQLTSASANTQDGARLDFAANGLWDSRYECTYFDIRVFNHLAAFS